MPHDPQQHLAFRQALLSNPDAQDCTIYRPNERDPDAEETDLGDARVLFTGAFEPPAEWDAEERDEFFGDNAPDLFVTARIECEAKPATSGYFSAGVGDLVATMPGQGQVEMYFIEDYSEDEKGRHYVLMRDDLSLD